MTFSCTDGGDHIRRSNQVPATLVVSARKYLELLLKPSGYQAWCCGFANRLPDGTVILITAPATR